MTLWILLALAVFTLAGIGVASYLEVRKSRKVVQFAPAVVRSFGESQEEWKLLDDHVEYKEPVGGKETRRFNLKPIAHYVDGSPRRNTNRFALTGDSAWPVGISELCDVRIDPRIAGKSPMLHFGKGKSFGRFALLGANNVSGIVDGNRTFFRNAWDNCDLTYTHGGHRLNEEILFRTGHSRSFAFRLDSHAGFNPETLIFGNDFRILDPVLEPPAGSDKMAIPLRWIVSQSGGKYILTVHLPDGDWAGWTLDPTLTLQPDAAAGMDTCTKQDTPAVAQGTNNYFIYNASATAREISLLKFDLSSLVGATVTAGTLYIYEFVGWTNVMTISAHAILAANSAWVEGCTWNYVVPSTARWAGDAAADGGTDAGCSVAGTDYNAVAMGSFVNPNPNPVGNEHAIVLNVAQLQAMIAANYGFCLINDTVKWAGSCSSDHATAAYRPKLVVEYTLPSTGMRTPGWGRWTM